MDRPNPIRWADVTPDGTMLVTVEGDEHAARLWSLPNLEPRGEIGEHRETVRQATFSPDGKQVLTASNDGSAHVYRLDGERVVTISTNAKVKRARFSADGQFILTCKAGVSAAAQLWRSSDGTEVVHFDGHRDGLLWGIFNQSGAWAATSALDGTTCLWPTDPVATAKHLPSLRDSDSTK